MCECVFVQTLSADTLLSLYTSTCNLFSHGNTDGVIWHWLSQVKEQLVRLRKHGACCSSDISWSPDLSCLMSAAQDRPTITHFTLRFCMANMSLRVCACAGVRVCVCVCGLHGRQWHPTHLFLSDTCHTNTDGLDNMASVCSLSPAVLLSSPDRYWTSS